MSTEQEDKLKNYASQHINDLETIQQKTVRINELKEELKHYKKETEELRKINEASEKENKKLLEMISKYDKGVSESNVVLAESNEKEIQLRNENQKLRELVKLLL